jgi:malignant T-cell-amplified sequence
LSRFLSIFFIRFNPKEDVASSTSLKSSVQRHIRTSLLEQYPFLAQPLTPSTENTTEPAPLPTETIQEDPEEEQHSKGGKGGKKKGGGKKDKSEKGKGKDKDAEGEKEGAIEEAIVLDELWPKKEALGITKWWVGSTGL